MKRFLIPLFVSLLLLIAFAVFSKYVKRGMFAEADFAVTVKLQQKVDRSTHLRTSALVGDLLEGSVDLASPVVSGVMVTILTAYLFASTRGWKRFYSLVIPVAFLGLILAETYGKAVVLHPSPPFMFLKNPATHFPAYYSPKAYSYPSGHAARAVFLVIVYLGMIVFKQFNHITIKPLLDKKYALLLLVGLFYIIAVSVSVIYLGHHWISDVVGGLLLGTALAMFTVLPIAWVY